MTDELRWILLGVGALLIVGLWLWESVRARRKPLADDAFNVTPPVQRPATTTGPGGVYRATPPQNAAEPSWEEPRWSAPEPEAFDIPDIHVEDDLPPLEPPVVELPDHHSVESTPALPVITPSGSAYDRPRGGAGVAEPFAPATASAASVTAAPVSVAPVSATPVRPASAAPMRPAASPVVPPVAPPVATPVATPAPPVPEQRSRPAAPPRQKIIALRLVGATANARFSGTDLRGALEAEGLVFGRYHIFHRELEEGRLLFSVASLIEPGSFELREMAAQEFPGVSLFAVLPGTVQGTEVLDELVGCGRRLASRLGGVLQDERRQPLTALRAMELRDEVDAFDRSLCAGGADDAD